jgi:hypothetical protein
MFHLAFSSGEEHASAAFHSIARAQSRGFEPRWPSIEDEEGEGCSTALWDLDGSLGRIALDNHRPRDRSDAFDAATRIRVRSACLQPCQLQSIVKPLSVDANAVP